MSVFAHIRGILSAREESLSHDQVVAYKALLELDERLRRVEAKLRYCPPKTTHRRQP